MRLTRRLRCYDCSSVGTVAVDVGGVQSQCHTTQRHAETGHHMQRGCADVEYRLIIAVIWVQGAVRLSAWCLLQSMSRSLLLTPPVNLMMLSLESIGRQRKGRVDSRVRLSVGDLLI